MNTSRGGKQDAVEVGVLEVSPAMSGLTPPEWPGAMWTGSIDVASIFEYSWFKLQGSKGYRRAKLLVREGSSVRGFVEVDSPEGMIECTALRTKVALLPKAPTVPAGTKSTPPITVVVCTRDRAAHLRGSLSAILRLDYPNFNVVVVDNASRTSATQDLVREEFSDPRLKLVLEPVPGLAQARNTGLLEARGDIVAFTDDDTAVDRDWLREIAAGFERDPGTACVSGLVPSGELRSRYQAYFDGRVSWSENVEPKIFSLAEPPADLPMFPFTSGAFSTGANFALKRKTALSIGGFDTAFGAGTRTGGAEDIDMFTRVILEGHSIVIQPSAIVWHRHRDEFPELRSQACAYGKALGAWITKVLTNPQTARMALARSPHAVRRLLSLGRPHRQFGQEPADQWDREMARLGRLELISVLRGPINYFIQRLSGKGVIR
ncbi:glycosyltransferase family 2 protein [Pseudarthrobacter sp. NamB4]|uniref:glycosyltransferase n=1 Tax=Pseudarthrobacter sp. NamB4 TaxID=2576837 RepID=UPI0010FE2022|nr:glycosyltransferase family 2 protein [Pseudarthrobacter sp. NamB4]TLM72141.1 glycosyltransferase [Pseudarthrobacter sp. NamB4]